MDNSILVHWAFNKLWSPKKLENRCSAFLVSLFNKLVVGMVHVRLITLFFHWKNVGRFSNFQGAKSGNVGAKSIKYFQNPPLMIPLNIRHCAYALNHLYLHCQSSLICHVWIISHLEWRSLFWSFSLNEFICVALPLLQCLPTLWIPPFSSIWHCQELCMALWYRISLGLVRISLCSRVGPNLFVFYFLLLANNYPFFFVYVVHGNLAENNICWYIQGTHMPLSIFLLIAW